VLAIEGWSGYHSCQRRSEVGMSWSRVKSALIRAQIECVGERKIEMVGTEALVAPNGIAVCRESCWEVNWFSKAAEEFVFGTFWLCEDKVYSRAQKPILR